jgi:hypothetical protein
VQMYLRLESALSRLAQSGWRWSREEPGPMYKIREEFDGLLDDEQAEALSDIIMRRLDRWEESRKTH